MDAVAAERFKTPLPASLAKLEAKVDASLGKPVVVHNPDVKPKVETVEGRPVDILSDHTFVPGDDEDQGEWKTKYTVLEKKFASQDREQKRQIQELTTTVASLQATIANLNDLLVQMRNHPAAPARETPEPKANMSLDADELDAGDFEGYGPEMTRLVGMVNDLKKENRTLKQQDSRLERIEAETAEIEQARFEAKVSELSPHWRTINLLPEFVKWLGDAGRTIAQTHATKRDHASLADVFNSFIRLTGWEPEQGTQGAEDGLESQVVPETGGAGPVIQQPKKRVSQAEYQEALRQFTKGQITEAQLDKVLIGYQQTVQAEAAARRGK